MIEYIKSVMIYIPAVISVYTKTCRNPGETCSILDNIVSTLSMNTILVAQNHNVLCIYILKKKVEK